MQKILIPRLIVALFCLTIISITNAQTLNVSGEQFYMDGQPFDMWGIRVASATQDEAQTNHLIAQLDDYKAHRHNTVTVFYQGSSGAYYNPFSSDGLTINSGHQSRMVRIIQACASRGMVVVVGIFYQNAPFGLRNADAVRNAVRTVTRSLRPYRNVIINIANEQNSGNWSDSAGVFDFRDPQRIIELCRIVHQEDSTRLVGGGGYDHTKNKTIGRSSDVDVLLFDTNRVSPNSDHWYDEFKAAGINKPMVNVEIFGADAPSSGRGVYSSSQKNEYYQEVDAGIAKNGLYIFFFDPAWSQVEPMRYDLAGNGTSSSPGTRWYFEYVRNRLGAPTPTPSTPTPTVSPTPNPGCQIASGGSSWINNLFTTQTGTFTVIFNATPSTSPSNMHVGLSSGAQSAYSGFAVIVRFNSSGNIDARNSGSYLAASTIPYSANINYQFRLVVNVPAHTYSIYVTPAGGTERVVGENFAFRTEQASVSQLNNWGAFVDASSGSLQVCNFSIGGGTNPTPTPSALIGEDCSSLANFTRVRGGTWSSSNGQCVLTAAATSCTGPLCNLLIHNTNVSGDLTLNVVAAAAASSSTWDDFAIVFGYVNASNYYYASFNESDDAATNGIFRVVGGTKTEIANFGSVTAPSSILHAIRIERIGSSIKIFRGSTLLGEVTDSTFMSGKVGFASFNNDANFDNLQVTSQTGTGIPNPTVTPTPTPDSPTSLIFPDTQWTTASPESQGLSSSKLDTNLSNIDYRGNIVVVRNGYLVKSMGDTSRTINIFSASKSITSLIFARLLFEGKVSYDQILPGSDVPSSPRASFFHFLTMTSDYGLTPHEPGAHYAYNNEAIKFYGEYMRKTYFSGKDAPSTIRAALFDILGHQESITIHPDPGIKGTPWAGGQQYSARDIARAGLLVLARGNWKGKQIIPAEYCDAIYKNQIPSSATVSKSPGIGQSGTNTSYNQQGISPSLKGNYSFGWWNNDSGRVGEDLPNNIAYASGRGGNYIIVIPDWKVVIGVTNNEPDNRPSPDKYISAVKNAMN